MHMHNLLSSCVKNSENRHTNTHLTNPFFLQDFMHFEVPFHCDSTFLRSFSRSKTLCECARARNSKCWWSGKKNLCNSSIRFIKKITCSPNIRSLYVPCVEQHMRKMSITFDRKSFFSSEMKRVAHVKENEFYLKTIAASFRWVKFHTLFEM